jgi:hypothetical protein
MNPNIEMNDADLAMAAEAQIDFDDAEYFNGQLEESFDEGISIIFRILII